MSDFGNSSHDERARRILSDAAGKRVVHLGCADVPYTRARLENGSLLHLQLLSVAPQTVGVDIDLEAMGLLQSHAPEALFCTPDTVPSFEESLPDVVIAGEVIEHIVDFVKFGVLLRRVAGPGTHLIVTTPNAFSLKAVIRALIGREQQHPDHKCLFSTETLQVMMRELGFELISKTYYNNPPRRLVSAPFGYALNALLRIAPRASDGLYFVFERKV